MVRRRRRGRGTTLKARGRGPHDRARAPDAAVLGPPATTRNPTHPSPAVLHGSVRMGCAFGGECPALGREACNGERAARCAWGVRSRRNARCATPDPPVDRTAMRWQRAAGAHGACARPRLPVRAAVLARPSTTSCRVRMGRALRQNCRYTATDSRIDRSRMRRVEHGRVRIGAFARRRPPVVWRLPRASTGKTCAGGGAGGCAWGVRSLLYARCATTDPPVDRSAVRWPRATGAHGACGRTRLPGAGGSAYEAVQERLPGAYGACAQAELPLHGNGFPNRPITDASGGARQGADRCIRSEAAARCEAAAPGLDRKDVCRWWSPRGAHGACAQGRMPVVWQWILRSTKGQRRCQADRCAWGVRSAPVTGGGGSAHEAVHGGSRVRMGRALRPDARYVAPNSLVDRSMPVAGVRQGAHPACARRGVRPLRGGCLRASTDQACASGGARR